MSDPRNDLPPGMTSEHNPELAARLEKQWEDYLWFLNQWDLREKYGDRVVLMHERRIVGSGQTGAEARADAARRAADAGVALPDARDWLVFIAPPPIWLDEPHSPSREAVPLESEDFSDLSELEGGR